MVLYLLRSTMVKQLGILIAKEENIIHKSFVVNSKTNIQRIKESPFFFIFIFFIHYRNTPFNKHPLKNYFALLMLCNFRLSDALHIIFHPKLIISG